MLKHLDDLSLQTKLIGIAVLCASVIAVGTLVGAMGMYQINDQTLQIYNHDLQTLRQVDQIVADMYQIRGDTYKFILNSLQRGVTQKQIDAVSAQTTAALTALEAMTRERDDQALIGNLASAWIKYQRALKDVLDNAQAGKEGASTFSMDAGDALTAQRAFTLAADAVRAKMLARAANAKAHGDMIFTVASALALVGGVLGVAIVLTLGIVIARRTTGAVAQTVQMIQEMGKGQLTRRLRLQRRDEIGVLAGTMDQFADDLQHLLNHNLAHIAEGDLDIAITAFSAQDEIAAAETRMIASLRALVNEINTLNHAATEGKLNVRGNAQKFNGGYRQVVQGMNDTLDAVIGPLNVAAEYVDRIAQGNIPAKITDPYRGDFNELKNNLNTCIDAIHALVADTDRLNQAALIGQFETRADAAKHAGDFRKIVDGINRTLDTVVEKIFWYEQLLDAIPVGVSVTDLNMNYTFVNKPVEEFLGARRAQLAGTRCKDWSADISQTGSRATFHQQGKDFQVDSAYLVNRHGERLGHVEVIREVTATTRRNEYTRVELERFTGNMRKFAEGNLDLDLRVAEPDEYTRGTHENYTKLNHSLRQVRDSVAMLLADVNALSQSAVEGNLTQRAEASRHGGDFRKIVEGVNATLDAVTQPVNQTKQILGMIAQGDLTVKMNGHYRGDFALLGESIETMVGGLNRLAAQSQLSASHIGSAASQILSSSTQMAANTREQASAVNQVTSTVRQIKVSAEQVAHRAQSVAAQATHAMQVADKGTAAVEETMEWMHDIRGKVEAIAENILALSEQTQQIGAIIDTVRDIAGQSNILALNAAIEAAQAGEAGRGFRVVADEVRNLAEQSRQAAAQVKVILGDIQKATNRAVMATEQGTKGVNVGSETVSRAAHTIQELTDSVSESAQAAQEIVAGVEQQTIGLDQIVVGMNEMTQAAQQTANGAAQSQQAAQTLTDTAAALQQSVARFTVAKSG
ncbi:MAG: HAMP domain-containing protein [Chloroflexi bacterium]|nr:HAMP domain-containing protein [Chloroflexota bacterium]